MQIIFDIVSTFFLGNTVCVIYSDNETRTESALLAM